MARRSRSLGLFGQLSFFNLFDKDSGTGPQPEAGLQDDAAHATNRASEADAPAPEREEKHEHGEQIRRQAEGLPGSEISGGVRGSGEGRDAGSPSDQNWPGREETVRPDRGAQQAADRSDRGSGEEANQTGAGRADGRGGGARRDRSGAVTPSSPAARLASQQRAAQNYTITPLDRIGQGGPKEKVRANIAAIRALKTLEEESREPTADEKQALVRYTGWGAFAQAIFDKDQNSTAARQWAAERAELQELLTAEEWESARDSTVNAHFTSEAVINGIWKAAGHLGFDGGRALEPAAGVGHFIGLIPDTLKPRTSWSAVELDTLSGRIAKALYPGADIRIEGFEKSRWPEGYFDLAISNVPFGNFGVSDRRYRHLPIHDYFFVKALDKVRAGGLVVFITSLYTLDKKASTARQEIARRAEFLGAIRLPGGANGAFKANAGTDVTTDIVFLRRRGDGEEPGDRSWLELKEIATPDGPIAINRYFADNPGMMLGEMRLERGMHASPTFLAGTRQPEASDGGLSGLARQIEEAARRLPAGVFRQKHRQTQAAAGTAGASAAGHKEGAYFIEGGRIFQRVAGVAEEPPLNTAERAKLTALLSLRDLVDELLKPPAATSAEYRDGLRARLNAVYDGFVSRYGPINRTLQTVTSRLRADGTPVVLRRMPNFALFRDDPGAFKVAALEDYDEKQDQAAKTAIFTCDVVRDQPPPVIETAADALAVSLNRTGAADLSFIADTLKIGEEEAQDALGETVWLDPAGDVWRTSADYLSGDVVQKLEDARIAARDDPRYQRNAEALERVQPAPLTRIDIRILCGAPWVPVEIYQSFLSEALSVPAEGLSLNEVSKRWQFTRRPEIPASTEAQYATPRASAFEIIGAALNNGEIRVFDPGPTAESAPVFNAAASEEANAKVAAIRELFSGSPETGAEGWIWQDEERAQKLEELYNLRFNRLVPTVYDGSHLTMPGLARYIGTGRDIKPFQLAPHQLSVIWRIVCSGNTLIDHCVGAGKTFSMIGAGQEQRRLGLIRLPMYVVPNHMLEQFAREFLQAYPAADILVADRESMTKDKRRAFSARIAAGNYDAIIITHDAFGRIRMSDNASKRFISSEIEALEEFKKKAEASEGTRSPTVKELEKAKKRLEARLDKLINLDRKDEGITFEELGADFLFIDEAHYFKNLSFRTRHTRVKGISATESQRATDLYIKIAYLEERRPGRSAVFATGTPVSNTIAEMYTMQRYLQPRMLAEYGIEDFDAWAATFGDIVTEVELAPSGRGFRTTRSFSRFVNIPELIALYSRVADTKTAEMLQLPRPKLKAGQVSVVETELSERELEIMDGLVQRAEAIKGKRASAGGDNMLKILGEGLRLATDIRLLDPDAPANPEGKAAAAIERIFQIWKDGTGPAQCQIVFCDMGVPNSTSRRTLPETGAGDDGTGDRDELEGEEEFLVPTAAGPFNLYEEIRARLAGKGIPREQIAFIHEADNDVKKARLFAAVREARVRILIGSTAKMGVGTNVQKQLVAMHHLDAPWRPADVEQRDGRILRQGNENAEVEIIRYITRRSLDAYRWQTLTRKANFIGQLRAGARGVRTAEDIDSPLPEAAMIKAAATGNPLIVEHAELMKEARELEAARRGHERSMVAAKTAYSRVKAKIAEYEKAIPALNADAARAMTIAEAPFALVIGERRFDERKPAGEALKAMLLSKAALLREGHSQKAFLQASMLGFQLEASLRHGASGHYYTIEVQRERSYVRQDSYLLTGQIDPVGLIRRFENCIKQVPAVLAAEEENLGRAKADLPKLERQLTAAAFARSDRLKTVKARITEIEIALQPEQQTAPQANAEALTGPEAHRLPAANLPGEEAVPAKNAKIASLQAEFGGQPQRNGRGRS